MKYLRPAKNTKKKRASIEFYQDEDQTTDFSDQSRRTKKIMHEQPYTPMARSWMPPGTNYLADLTAFRQHATRVASNLKSQQIEIDPTFQSALDGFVAQKSQQYYKSLKSMKKSSFFPETVSRDW